MTSEEALKLKVGEVVEVKTRGRRIRERAVVVRQCDPRAVMIYLRRTGVTRTGKRRPATYYYLSGVFSLRGMDGLRGNIFADYLEDHGEARAAQMLREAFPLAPREVTSG